jgi:hypothetical protein
MPASLEKLRWGYCPAIEPARVAKQLATLNKFGKMRLPKLKCVSVLQDDLHWDPQERHLLKAQLDLRQACLHVGSQTLQFEWLTCGLADYGRQLHDGHDGRDGVRHGRRSATCALCSGRDRLWCAHRLLSASTRGPLQSLEPPPPCAPDSCCPFRPPKNHVGERQRGTLAARQHLTPALAGPCRH